MVPIGEIVAPVTMINMKKKIIFEFFDKSISPRCVLSKFSSLYENISAVLYVIYCVQRYSWIYAPFPEIIRPTLIGFDPVGSDPPFVEHIACRDFCPGP